tara:strand:- start:2957 stop:3529 length:573 start_codon:yes stop_codon:yes gene_type:complete
MPITITVKDDEEATPEHPPPEQLPKKKNPSLKMNLDLRKAVDGSLMVFDHPDLDIVIVPSTNKVVTFPKESYNDGVYVAQSRLFKHLLKAGIVTPGTVQGGNVHGALGGTILAPENSEFPIIDLVVLSVGKFIEKEKPDYLFADAYEKEVEDMYIEPTDEDSTPLGKVPQSVKKGTIQPYDVRRYLTGIY